MNNKRFGITDLLFMPIYIPLAIMYGFCWIIWNGLLFVGCAAILYASCALLLA